MALATLTDEESATFSVQEIDAFAEFFDLLAAFDLTDKKLAAEAALSTIGGTAPGSSQGTQSSTG